MISWICQVCHGLVEQQVDYTGFPERAPSCPHCQEEARKCAERIRQREMMEKRAKE